MKKITHKLLSVLLTFAVAISIMLAFSVVASAGTTEETTGTVGNYKVLLPQGVTLPDGVGSDTTVTAIPTGSGSESINWGSNGTTTWYVVTGNVNITKAVYVEGNVNLILCDGCTLSCTTQHETSPAIRLNYSNISLTVYAGSSGNNVAGTGVFNATKATGGSGIYNYYTNGCKVIINGGTVNASSGGNGDCGISTTLVEVNGGIVNATGGKYDGGTGGCGIGATTVTVNGGKVNAVGGNGTTKGKGINIYDSGSFTVANGLFVQEGDALDSLTVVTEGLPVKQYVKVGPLAAEITADGGTTTKYASVQEAINAANGQTVKMIADSTENVSIASGKDIILDLNGYVLTGAGNGSVITNKGTLTIKDSNTDAQIHKFKVKSNLWIHDETSQKKQITGGCITGGTGYKTDDSKGGGIYVDNNATLTIDGGSIVGNTADYGGGIFVNTNDENCNVTMNGGAVIGNTSIKDGAGVAVQENGTFVMNKGAVISNNTATVGGGGVYIRGGSFTMNGGEIKSNNATVSGAGVYVYHNGEEVPGKFTMNSGTIKSNKAADKGGGVYVDDYAKVLIKGTITGNQATGDSSIGGGVCCNSPITVDGAAKITGNTVTGSKNANNVYLRIARAGEKSITAPIINCGESLSCKTAIGVSTDVKAGSQANIKIVETGGSDFRYFSSDDGDYYVNYDKTNCCLELGKRSQNACEVASTQYKSINEALTANSGETSIEIKMLADSTENVSIESDKNITLDLNDHVLKAENILSGVITNKGNLTIKDTSESKTARYFSDTDSDGCYETFSSSKPESGTEGKEYITVTGGVITDGNAENGGGIYSTGILAAENVNVVGNQSKYGGGIRCSNTGTEISLNMNGGTVAGNLAIQGGGIYAKCNAELSDVKVCHNSAVSTDESARGGGIYFYGNSTNNMIISGSTVSDNSSCGKDKSIGGGIYIGSGSESLGEAIIKDTTVEGNTCVIDTDLADYTRASGGGISVTESKLTLEGATEIINNSAVNKSPINEAYERHAFGGGLYGGSKADISISSADVLISGNTADASEYANEEAKIQGGGVYTSATSKFVMTAGKITGNIAKGHSGMTSEHRKGGGVCVTYDTTPFEIGGTADITGNYAVDENCKKVSNNVYLRYDDTRETYANITLSGTTGATSEEAPTTMKIGVSHEGGEGFVADLDTIEYGKWFTSDNDNYYITTSGNKVWLAQRYQPDPDPSPSSEITIPVSGGKDAVPVKAEIKDNNVIVETITKEDLSKIGTDENVKIDVSEIKVSGKVQEISEITLNKETLKNVDESGASGLEINLSTADVIIDQDTLKAVIEQAEGNEIHLVVEKDEKAEETMTDAQKETIENMNQPVVLDAYFVCNGKRISDFQGGKVKIRAEYSTEKPVRVWFVKGEGGKEKIKSVYDSDKQIASFDAEHFSHYVIEAIDENPYVVSNTVASGKTALKVTWTECEGASDYAVYANKCNTKGKKYSLKKIAVTANTTYTFNKIAGRKLAKHTFYKVKVVALDASGNEMATANTMHVATGGYKGKYGNTTRITAQNAETVVSVGDTATVGVKTYKVYKNKKAATNHAAKVRYLSSNKNIATVNDKGVVTGVKSGTCTIYMQAPNGLWTTSEVTVLQNTGALSSNR